MPPVPPAPADRRTLIEEVLIVLALSVLNSAVFAVLDLLSAPLKGVVVAVGDQSIRFSYQFLDFVFGLVPVFLVLHLVRRDGEGLVGIGLQTDRPARGRRARALAVRDRRGGRPGDLPRRGGARA